MTFSAEVKNELCQSALDSPCCNRAELCALIAFCGTVMYSKEGIRLKLKTENRNVADRIMALFKAVLNMEPVFSERKKKTMCTYIIMISEKSRTQSILKSFSFLEDGFVKFKIDPLIVNQTCCRRAFFRGAFLGAGSLSSPEKSYHLEIETHFKGLSQNLAELLADEQLGVKTVIRKSSYVIYMKDSDMIGDFLAATGASDMTFEFYNIKILKNMKNHVNRRVNCETANITKVANAAAKQIQDISTVLNSSKKSRLGEGLLELCNLRLLNPEVSLLELGRMLSVPLSKSGVSHRLKKISALAEEVRQR